MDCETEDKTHKPLKLHYLFWTIISALVPSNLQKGRHVEKVVEKYCKKEQIL